MGVELKPSLNILHMSLLIKKNILKCVQQNLLDFATAGLYVSMFV